MSQPPESSVGLSQVQPVEVIPAPGRVAATSRAQYLAKAQTLKRYSEAKRTRDPEEPVGVSILEAVQDLAARTDLSWRSLNAYRSAMLWYLRDAGDQSEMARTAYKILLDLLPPKNPADKPQTKKKSIPEKDYEDLINELSAMGSTSLWALRTLAWVQATLACGARPVEWLNAHFRDQAKTTVVLVTAKSHLEPPRFMGAAAAHASPPTPEGLREAPEEEEEGPADEGLPLRVAGGERVITLNAPIERLMTELHLGYFQAAVQPGLPLEQRLDAFRKYHDQCRWTLRRACQRLWKDKKNYTFYTFRSQFQANQRAMAGAQHAAQMMGHSSVTSTSTSHYGKANQAFARFKGRRPAADGQVQIEAAPDGEGGTDSFNPHTA